MMLPILISVSVAPVSYFFCASAPLAEAANRANAVEAMARRVACIKVSPCQSIDVRYRGFLDRKALVRLARMVRKSGYRFSDKIMRHSEGFVTILPPSGQQKAPATRAQG